MSSSGLVSAASKTLKQFYTHSPAAVYKINVRPQAVVAIRVITCPRDFYGTMRSVPSVLPSMRM